MRIRKDNVSFPGSGILEKVNKLHTLSCFC
jgi:hypothetical protein